MRQSLDDVILIAVQVGDSARLAVVRCLCKRRTAPVLSGIIQASPIRIVANRKGRPGFVIVGAGVVVALGLVFRPGAVIPCAVAGRCRRLTMRQAQHSKRRSDEDAHQSEVTAPALCRRPGSAVGIGRCLSV